MYDRHCDIPHGKIGMFMSEILKQQAGRITPLIANTYSVDAGRTVEQGILASSDRCLLNADGAAGPLQVASSLTHFQLDGYIEECCWSVYQLCL